MMLHSLRRLLRWSLYIYWVANNNNFPNWEPNARRGVYLGSPPTHLSNVPLVLTLKTGFVMLQYHVVFDDCFSTVDSCGSDDFTAELWKKLFFIQTVHLII